MPWIHQQKQDSSLPIAEETYYLDADGNVTTDSKVAVLQLAAEGSPISKEIQEKHGIPKGKVARQSDTAAVEEDSEKAASPKANKKASPSKNKGVK